MAHINPIQSRPLSAQGRENYDKIFRKRDPLEISHKLRKQLQDRHVQQAREFYIKLAQRFEDIPTELNHHI